jgi:superfamily I DNA and/or RNA helicase
MVRMLQGESENAKACRVEEKDDRLNFVLFCFAQYEYYSPGYIAAANVLNGKVYSFLQVTGMERQAISGSFENEAEAQAVVTLVQELRSASSSHHHNGGRWNSADRIRIITFYQAQVTLLKRMLQQERLGDIVVATVDSSQGCEADVVIISFVRSMGSAYTSGRTSVGFLSDDRRMNVALTRGEIVVAFLSRMNSCTLDCFSSFPDC